MDNKLPPPQSALEKEVDVLAAKAEDPHDLKELVRQRYGQTLEARKSNPDRKFYAGHDLRLLDSNLITFDNELCEDPRDWSNGKKWLVTVIVGAYAFLAPFTSTIFAPCLPAIMDSVGITDPTIGALQVSIFLFSFALSPLMLAPLSEIYGRKIILIVGNVVFIAFSIGAGFSTNAAALALCRFFSGFGGSSSHAVFGGVLADIWNLKDRAKASGILAGVIMIGPVLGPLCGGFISESISWRWTCWAPAIASTVLQVLSVLYLNETYVPTLLRRKLLKAKKTRPEDELYTVLDLVPKRKETSQAKYLLNSMLRPIVYLILDPALGLISLFYAFVFGVLYLVIVTFYEVFGEGGYGHSAGIVGVDLLAMGVGACIALVITVRLLDITYKWASSGKKEYRSETRLFTAFGGALIMAAGLFMYGFTALRAHFMVPLVGFAIFSFGLINAFMAVQLYIIDSFDYPASAIAAFSFLRCVFAGAFPLFGHSLFEALGIDWGNALLAFLSLGLGVPFLPLIYVLGPRLREMGKKNRARFGW